MGLGPDEVVICGMSCGYEDKEAAVNHLDMPRETLEGIARLAWFRGVADRSLEGGTTRASSGPAAFADTFAADCRRAQELALQAAPEPAQ